jgi:hypothetical protein
MSSHLELFQLFWIGIQIAQGVLCLWIALLVFRSRSAAGWITLVAAILSPLFSLAAQLWQQLALRSLASSVAPSLSIEVPLALYVGNGVATLAFAVGLLLYLQRRKLESDRIADLEAILHDLQHRPADASPQPPK